MNQLLSKMAAAATLLLLSSTAIGSPVLEKITGKVEFFGSATYSQANNEITMIDFIGPVTASDGSESFANINNEVAVFEDPYTMGPVKSLWSVGGFSFEVTNISYNEVMSFSFGSFAHIAANGFISGNGFEKTAAAFSWSTQPGGTSFSASAIPEPATIALLGLSLIGFGALRRKKS